MTLEAPGEWRSRLPPLTFGLVAEGRRQGLVVTGMFATCAKYFIHPGASGVISGYFGPGPGGPTSSQNRILGFEESLGDLMEELVVMCFRKLAAGLHLEAEKLP